MTVKPNGPDTDMALHVAGLVRRIEEAKKTLSGLPMVQNPLWSETLEVRDIMPGRRAILINYGEEASLETVLFEGFLRQHSEGVYVSVSTGSLNLIEAGILPDNSGGYVGERVAFAHTQEGLNQAEDFLYSLEDMEDGRGDLLYPNVADLLNQLIALSAVGKPSRIIGYGCLEEEDNPRTRPDLLL